ncbi:MAG: hypothetical protein BGO87_09505 [Flavobacteriia bacterium 40-80]|nr:MAG: hypothetical protein BGO87_09505 [Flavobacteriia bacterium 40-80]
MGTFKTGSAKMKKITGILLLILGTVFSYAQQNQVDSKGRKQGDWVKYYPNSKHIEYKGTFKDDKPTGVFYYYEYDGTVKMVANHNPVTGRSEVYFYHDNKAVKASGIFRNMKKDSVWTYYSNTGIISKRETYKNGFLEGMVYSYYVNNMKKTSPQKVCEEIPYKGGKKNGVAKEYYIDGTLKKECIYKDDKLTGTYKTYLPGGVLESESYFYNNNRHGVGVFHTASGKQYSYFIYGEKVPQDDYKKWLEKCAQNKVNTNLPK